jgi:hypothetical protein
MCHFKKWQRKIIDGIDRSPITLHLPTPKHCKQMGAVNIVDIRDAKTCFSLNLSNIQFINL